MVTRIPIGQYSFYLKVIICLHMGKWLQVLLFNISNSVYKVFLCNMKNLHTAVWFQITTTNHNP